jgi:predicted  nucleic acid-binding Zn-ribbon protein
LQRQRDTITDKLTTATDHVQLRALGAELTAAQAELDRAEELWLALAEAAEG